MFCTASPPVRSDMMPTFTDVGVIPGCDEQEVLLADAAAVVALLPTADVGEPLLPVVVGLLLLEELPQAESAPARRATIAIVRGIWLTAMRPLTSPPPHAQRILYSSLSFPPLPDWHTCYRSTLPGNLQDIIFLPARSKTDEGGYVVVL